MWVGEWECRAVQRYYKRIHVPAHRQDGHNNGKSKRERWEDRVESFCLFELRVLCCGFDAQYMLLFFTFLLGGAAVLFLFIRILCLSFPILREKGMPRPIRLYELSRFSPNSTLLSNGHHHLWILYLGANTLTFWFHFHLVLVLVLVLAFCL